MCAPHYVCVNMHLHVPAFCCVGKRASEEVDHENDSKQWPQSEIKLCFYYVAVWLVHFTVRKAEIRLRREWRQFRELIGTNDAGVAWGTKQGSFVVGRTEQRRAVWEWRWTPCGQTRTWEQRLDLTKRGHPLLISPSCNREERGNKRGTGIICVLLLVVLKPNIRLQKLKRRRISTFFEIEIFKMFNKCLLLYIPYGLDGL